MDIVGPSRPPVRCSTWFGVWSLTLRLHQVRDRQQVRAIVLTPAEAVTGDVDVVPLLCHGQQHTGQVDGLLLVEPDADGLEVRDGALCVLGWVDALAADVA